MAVSARFLADFSSFQQAVDRAELKLTSLRSESGRVEKQLQRMGDSFSGKKIFADAELATKAVQGLGGVSALTADEQRRLNGIVTEAISKYKALGQEAPKHLTEIAKATTPVNTGLSSILGTITKIGPALGVGLSLGAVTSFAKGIGEMAGKFVDLNAQTQISITRLQSLDYVGSGAGLTIEDITTSADQLAKRLGGGDASVSGALQKLNLNVSELQQLGLDEVMFRIDDGLKGVGNQFDRARILADFFGKSGAQLGRIMTGSLREVTQAAEDSGAVIDEEMIKAADAFDDAWTQAWKRFRAGAFNAVNDAKNAIAGLIPDKTDFEKKLNASGINRLVAQGPQQQIDTIMANIRSATSALPKPTSGGLPGIVPPSAQEMARIEKQSQAITKSAEAQIKWNDAREKEREAIEAASQGMSYWIAKIEKFPEVLQKGFSVLDAAILPSGNLDTRALMGLPGAVSQKPFGGVLTQFPGRTLSQSFGRFAGDLPDVILSAITGGGSITKGIGSLLGSSLLGSGTGLNKVLTGGLTGVLGKTVGGIAGSILPGIGSLLGPAISGLGKLFGGLFGGEGKQTNRARDSAISDFTGITGDKGASQAKFRELAAAAGIASVEIDKLFSTGKIKNFDAEFARITERMKAFTTDQDADQERLNAAIEKYGFTLEQLGPKFQKQRLDDQAKELIEDWRVLIDSGIEITDVNNAMAEEINQYLQTAMKLGTEVPNAFRPILQKMLEQGTLTDEAGNAITDLEDAGIHFSETMTEGFDKVVKKLDELIEKLGIASVQLGALPAPPSGLANTSGMSASDLVPVPMASGGRFRVNRPTLFLAGERGPEDAAFSGANRQFGGDSSAVVAAIEKLGSDFGYLRSTLTIAVRDAVLLAR